MALFNVEIRRESVKAAQAFGTLLGERVNKAAWKTYLPALIDLVIAADRGDETAADKVDALLVDGITLNDIIALGAACKVVGVTGGEQVYKIVYKLGAAAQNDTEFVDRVQAALGGYQTAMAFARATETEDFPPPTDEEAAASRQHLADYIKKERAKLVALVDATSKTSKTKQLAMLYVYVETATGAVASPDYGPFDGNVDYRAQFQAAVVAEMEAAKVPAHVIEAYKAQAAADKAESMAFAGYADV